MRRFRSLLPELRRRTVYMLMGTPPFAVRAQFPRRSHGARRHGGVPILRFARPIMAALLLGSVTLHAEPPPGHPGVEEAERMLQLPKRRGILPHAGEVIAARDSNGYTYVQVTHGDGSRWLAVPRTALAPGMQIRYGDGRVFHNWYSRKLQRSFDAVLFVGDIQILQ